MAIREHILGTEGVTEIISLDAKRDPDTRKMTLTATINTRYGKTTVTSER
ncbi:Putative bacteriophage protein (fragment) [Xenorhabdus bovienii str. feltiae Moldova]